MKIESNRFQILKTMIRGTFISIKLILLGAFKNQKMLKISIELLLSISIFAISFIFLYL